LKFIENLILTLLFSHVAHQTPQKNQGRKTSLLLKRDEICLEFASVVSSAVHSTSIQDLTESNSDVDTNWILSAASVIFDIVLGISGTGRTLLSELAVIIITDFPSYLMLNFVGCVRSDSLSSLSAGQEVPGLISTVISHLQRNTDKRISQQNDNHPKAGAESTPKTSYMVFNLL
jgi:hypothetical protein